MLESVSERYCRSAALSRPAMDTAGGDGGEPGVWLPLRRLRQLNLPYGAYHRLITGLRAEAAGAAGDDPLLAELAEASATALREALEQADLEAALAAHENLLGSVIELAAVRQEVAAVLWHRYGDLLGQLTVQVHRRVIPQGGESPDFGAPERAGDGELCLRIAKVLERAAPHPWPVPEWLPVLEQQLVQHGALALGQRVGVEAAGACLDLFLRLSGLLDPLPEWVVQGCRSAMARLIEGLPGPGAISEPELVLLLERVGRLPVAAERRPTFDAALLRARFSLELLQQGRGAAGRPAPEGLEVLEAVWLEEEPEGAPIDPLPSVEWRPGALVVELDALELLVLRHAEAREEALEEALAELRRRHHDGAFWSAPAAPLDPALPDVVEVLRRFQAEAGFYATTHAPLESLRHWARSALQALLLGQVWSADPDTQDLWLTWGLEGVQDRLRQPPGGRGLLERLGGAEVVVVGQGVEVLQEAHRAGRLFAGGAFGLRCLEVPESRHPHRPAAGFELSLEALVVAVEELYRERPFTVLLAGTGAYRLPLAQAMVGRFGVLAVAAASPLLEWLLA
jgi:hypothetical protein